MRMHGQSVSASIRISKQSGVIDREQLHLHSVNPIPTGTGWNQPLYERHVTKSGRNRVKQQIHLRKRADRTSHSMLGLDPE